MLNKSKVLFIVLFTLFSFVVNAQKKKITHNDYNSWKGLSSSKISNDGKWVSYEINPQEGDGYIYLYNNIDNQLDSIARGFKGKFSPSNNLFVFKMKPYHDTLTTKRRAKVKKDLLPKDSLAIYNLKSNEITKFPRVKSYKLPKKAGNWVAFQHEKPLPKKDTTSKAKKSKLKKPSSDFGMLVVSNPNDDKSYEFNNISEYSFSDNGNLLGMIYQAKDSIDRTAVIVFNTLTQKTDTLFSADGKSKKITVDTKGNQVAYLFSQDTIKNKIYKLAYHNLLNKNRDYTIDGQTQNMPIDWTVSEFGKISFSKSGKRLYLGTAKTPTPEVKDTLLPEEKVSIDIWNWKDNYLQPKQLIDAKKNKEKSFLAIFYPEKQKFVQICNETIPNASYDKKIDGQYILTYSDIPYQYLSQWDISGYDDYYLTNVKDGKSKKIFTKLSGRLSLSPDQKYIAWYNKTDSTWNLYNVKKENSINLSSELVDIPFYNEENDMPITPGSYGIVGWLPKDEGFLVYDKYDVWKFDPKGKKKPYNLTQGFGRKNNIKFRYISLNPDDIYVKPEGALFRAFNEKTKGYGYYTLSNGKVNEQLAGGFLFSYPKKAKNSNKIIWTKQNFEVYPDLHVSTLDFSDIKKISNTNPQQKDYNWGTVELFEWESFNNQQLQGLLYKPENFDPNKKYPMLVYFYETYTERMHYHYLPKPIRSVINFPYYLSNEYIIFIPDIKYRVGYPGKDAFNAILSGVQALTTKYHFIDKEKMGIQGQSWGGYQVAYLVTQTDIFAAAMAGAPVSNMTSAYGGIRWKSGLNRMFQYEQTQSRIGGTLWEKPAHYIENSPLFFAPKIKTPLLIMANDNDGAVPWYQGIELFVALKRLQKPVWMLNYNNAPHNLSRRADCKDLTVRMQQYFDHYLKGKPAPEWMIKGVPATEKGKNFGFKLINEKADNK